METISPTNLDELRTIILSTIYPVGSYFITEAEGTPNSILNWGGGG